jgi:alkylation response protein AidB-like acyl-CoA dehydrogenase
LIVVAKSSQDSTFGLFLVSPQQPGVGRRALRTLSEEPVAEFTFGDVVVGHDAVLNTDVDGLALDELIDCADLLRSAEMVGGAEVAMELAVDYAKFRVAFDKPLGAFQALQHKMANMLIETDSARVITYYAAWLTDQGMPAAAERAMAQFQAGSAYRSVTSEATQIFGGMGVMRESDIALYFRHAKALQVSMGPADALRERMLAPLAI